MKITNKYNLPPAIYQAALKMISKEPPQPHVIRVTSLIAPPLVRYLTMKHWDDLSQDCSEMLWAILGQSVHSVLDKVDLESASIEQALRAECKGWTITGRPDLLHDGILQDWKVTSVYSFLLGDKPEWTAQLNVYRWMLRQSGYIVNDLYIHAILRDWQASKAYDADYPKIPFLSNKLAIWPDIGMDVYIQDCLSDHDAAENGSPRPCSAREKWERKTTYAVMKEGRKAALRVFDDLSLANTYLSDAKEAKISIETRPGAAIRCQNYCIVRDVCQYNQKEVTNDK